MTTTHVARAVGTTGASAPQWRGELRAGDHRLIADEPPVGGGGDAERTPVTLAARAGTPIDTTVRADDAPPAAPSSP